jgi:cell wall-associated NlpC family hydrolase
MAILARVAWTVKGSRRRLRIVAVASFALAIAIGVTALLSGLGKDVGAKQRLSVGNAGGSLSAIRDSEEAQSFPEPVSSKSHKLAEDPAQAAARAPVNLDTGPSPGAPSDAQVRRDLRQLKRYQRRARSGGSIDVGRGGLVRAPAAVPGPVADLVAGGNAIATFPYRLGGGHGSFVDNAYDCSGSVSYALAAAGMLDAPLTSGELMKWGVPGPGRWLTVYANPGHVYMTVGGLRFDTSGRAGPRGSRWQAAARSSRGFVTRHWPAL